ncbi:MAG TPA: sigma-70 family RNA polymerase sigma factor, partial [Kofleriaceae bacterium]|nr:sigma-70 family RNA polymerase sigma factor [Kofleriaceae bacterium]
NASVAEYLEQRSNASRGTEQQAQAATSATEALTKVRDAMAAIKTVYLTSLDAAGEKGFDIASTESDPAAKLALEQKRVQLRDAINGLPEKERNLLTKHYYEGKTLDAAGAELGISKSWASRIHAQAIDRLRLRVAEE